MIQIAAVINNWNSTLLLHRANILHEYVHFQADYKWVDTNRHLNYLKLVTFE